MTRNSDLTLDMDLRDPNNLNEDKRTQFEDVIGEPRGSYSADCVWINAFKGYRCGYNCCYLCLTYVCAIPLAFLWGCHFSCVTFFHIWTITPCARSFKINFDAVARFLSAIIHCCYDPCYESMALLFTQIYVNVNHGEGRYQPRTYLGLTVYSRDEQKGKNEARKSVEI